MRTNLWEFEQSSDGHLQFVISEAIAWGCLLGSGISCIVDQEALDLTDDCIVDQEALDLTDDIGVVMSVVTRSYNHSKRHY